MTDQPNQQLFDDPGLKVALKRDFGGERAPATLRQRIAAGLAEDAAPLVIRPEFNRSRRAVIAAAAIILVGLVLSAVLPKWLGPSQPIPRDTLLAMVRTHQFCCTHADHHGPGVRHESFATVADSMGENLKIPVLSVDLSDEKWKFRGGAMCPVGQAKSGHLLFDRDGQTMSIFSFADDCDCPPGIHTFDVDGHVIAVSARDGALHCFVGHCPQKTLTPQYISDLLARHSTRKRTGQIAFH